MNMSEDRQLPPEQTWTSLGLDMDTYSRLKKLADEDGRSMIGELRWLIRHEEIDRAQPIEKEPAELPHFEGDEDE